MTIFKDDRIWRVLSYVWTVAFIVFLAFNFLNKDIYEGFVGPFSIVYIGILGFYVGTKEFSRWCKLHHSRHPGEIFVIAWTVLILAFFILPFFLGPEYKTSSETVTDYIVVLSVFALTQQSKRMCEEEIEKNNFTKVA